MEITIAIDKKKVLAEVGKTTAYCGKKDTGDPEAYERMGTTEHDGPQLERFWNESCSAVCFKLKLFLQNETSGESGYIITLNVSPSFDAELTASIRDDMFSFFVNNIIAKWFSIAAKPSAGDYSQAAGAYLESLSRKVYYKKRPIRPTYN